MRVCIFEEVNKSHLPFLTEMYNYYILNTTATFFTKCLTQDEMANLLFFENPRYITYVIKNNQNICGYCGLIQYKDKDAYDYTAEVTLYLAPEYTGKGLGKLAMEFIEDIAMGRKFHVLIGIICDENEASKKLVEKCGYEKCAHYREVGRKFGRWLDVVVYQKILPSS